MIVAAINNIFLTIAVLLFNRESSPVKEVVPS
jgi:hypothetical protein